MQSSCISVPRIVCLVSLSLTHGVIRAVVAFIVQDKERNFMDQKGLEYALWEQFEFHVCTQLFFLLLSLSAFPTSDTTFALFDSLWLTYTNVAMFLVIARGYCLSGFSLYLSFVMESNLVNAHRYQSTPDGIFPVSIVYFRAGYSPSDYPTTNVE